jgi:hypothetical protein
MKYIVRSSELRLKKLAMIPVDTGDPHWLAGDGREYAVMAPATETNNSLPE